MKLKDLFQNFSQITIQAEGEVKNLTQDSRQVEPGSVFVAIRGNRGDGHDFLDKVKAAAVLVVEDRAKVPKDFAGAVVQVSDTRKALEKLAETLYAKPAFELDCVGVTGTNGKTTTSYMIETILNAAGRPCGVLGTIDHHLQKQVWASELTTPDPVTLHKRLREFKNLGARSAAFEVSSHALSQSRADSIPFAVGIFTNFTRDHLDYHKTMEDYFAAKERLFKELIREGGTAVLNGDDVNVAKTQIKKGVTRWSFGMNKAEFQFRVVREDLSGTLFDLKTPKGEAQILLPTPGLHNVYNAAGALAAAIALGVQLETAANAIATFRGAPGRLERVENERGLNIFVDYAHTDDALRSVLSALIRLRGNSKAQILTVFGCGGDRDAGKRPLMAKAAAEFSDTLLMTSDNPRTEDPEAILDQIEVGVPRNFSGRKLREVNRREALRRALQLAKEGDVILVAGKGHEDYQILGTTKYPFSDAQVITELLQE